MAEKVAGNSSFGNVVPIQSDLRKAAQDFGAELDHELLTILFTDLVDSTKLQSEVGNVESARLLEKHRSIIRTELSNYTAREIEWAGDSCLAVFSKPSDAVAFSLRVQAVHNTDRKTEPHLPRVRIGIHIGEIIIKKSSEEGKKTEDLFGLQVSETARIMSIADGDQILCSRAIYDNAKNSLIGKQIDNVSDLQWRNHGSYDLKGSNEPLEICEVGDSNVAPLSAPVASDKCKPVQFAQDQITDGNIFTQQKTLIGVSVGIVLVVAVALVLIFSGILSIAPLERTVDPALSELSTDSSDSSEVRRSYLGLSIQPVDPSIIITPDGSSIVYSTRAEYGFNATQLAVQELGTLRARLLDGTEGAMQMFVSPDGQNVGYYDSTQYRIDRIPLQGGTVSTITMGSGSTSAEYGSSIAHWVDNQIYYGLLGAPIRSISANGGEAEPITNLQETDGNTHTAPFLLPENKGILYTSINGPNLAERDVYIKTGDEPATLLLSSAYNARYIPTGHLIYFTNEVAMAIPFDINSLSFIGEAVPVNEEGLSTNYSISDSGTLVYFEATNSESLGVNELSWVSMDGLVTPTPVSAKDYSRVRMSPDGEYAVVSADGDVWLLELRRLMLQKLTNNAAEDRAAIFDENGETILFSSDRGSTRQIYQMLSVDSEPQVLTPFGPSRYPESWDPISQTIVFSQFTDDETGFDIGLWQLGANNDSTFEIVVQTTANEGNATISPNGKWVAYVSDEQEHGQVFVAEYPSFNGKYQVSIERGSEPAWAPDGSAIYFRSFPSMMKVDVEAEDEFRADTPVELFSNPDLLSSTTGSRMYDIHPDGDRFLMISNADQNDRINLFNLVVVENWFENIKQIAPVSSQ